MRVSQATAGHRLRTVIAAGLLFVVGCGEPPAETGAATTAPSDRTTTTSLQPSTTTTTRTVVSGSGLIVLPGESGELPVDLEVGCPSGPWFPVSALDETVPVEERPEIEGAIAPFLDSAEGTHWPQKEWRILHATDSEVIVVHIEQATPTVGFMYVTLEDDGWTWSGSSLGESCPLQVRTPEGLNNVSWRIDPDATPLTPDSTALHLLATEGQCASGQPMGDRLRQPHVVVTADQVLVAMAADPPPGDVHTCQGNPHQEVVIDLGMPLGDREVVDGLAMLGRLEDLIG